MAASLHLARYSPRQAGRMLRAMWRHREALEATPGLAAARICFSAELDTITGGRPTPTRWGLLCGWESGKARGEFLSDPTALRPFLDGARESWRVRWTPSGWSRASGEAGVHPAIALRRSPRKSRSW